MTRGVCDSVPPHPPHWGGPTWKGQQGSQIRKVDGPRAGSVPPRTAAGALGGLAPPQHREHSPGLAGPRFRESPESLPDSHTVQLSWTRCVHWGAAAVQPQPLLGKGYGQTRPAPAPTAEGALRVQTRRVFPDPRRR